MSEYPDNAEYNKLVRDKIPEIIQNKGLSVETYLLSNEEVMKELVIKAVEEAKELSEATDKDDVLKEMADVLEVLKSISERLGISMDEVEQIRQTRAEKRGRFETGTYLVRTYRSTNE